MAKQMKLMIEVVLEHKDGPVCDDETVSDEILSLIDGEVFYPANPNKETESTYEVVGCSLKEV